MKPSALPLVLAAAASNLAGVDAMWRFGFNTNDRKALDALVERATSNIWGILEARTSNPSATCTSRNVVVRVEWSTLEPQQKDSYIRAVQCLQEKKAITPRAAGPGVKTRFQDFAALHINETANIYHTSRFYTWQRQFLHLYEKALRDECGYTGYQPYWDWSSTKTVDAHPLFDGTPLSLGGNGLYSPGNGPYTFEPTTGYRKKNIAPGTGGDCVISGPFADRLIKLGPHGPPLRSSLDGLSSRCLRRDFRDSMLQTYLRYPQVADLMKQNDLLAFDRIMAHGTNLHDSGLRAIGGECDDLWSCPQDPAYYFHHAQIDRLLTLWQGLDQETRTKQVIHTLTYKNRPPSDPGLLSTVIDMGFLDHRNTIGDLSSTINGPFCYTYA
ncbi:unnamed protein product [Diplocarpon coronariae]|nr:hypothetical protein JHW43_005597 [Diplocarpon mali]